MTSRLSALLVLFSCVLCFSGSQAFRVLRGEDQLPMEDLKHSNYFNLIDLALKTDEAAMVELSEDTQMLIAQHGSRITLDCSSLMSTGQPLNPMQWEEFRLAQGKDGVLVQDVRPRFFSSGFPDRITITGPLDRYLNITYANIVEQGEVADNGVYVCTACTTTGCRSSNLTIFMVGTLFELVQGKEDDVPTSKRKVDRIYNIGTNFCVEEGSNETIQLRCDAIAQDSNLPILVPAPSRAWTQNNNTVYSVPRAGLSVYRRLNQDFFTNSVLKYDVTSPPAFEAYRDGSLLMNFDVKMLNFPELAPDSSAETIKNDVFEALLGTWTCSLATDLQSAAATTVITKC